MSDTWERSERVWFSIPLISLEYQNHARSPPDMNSMNRKETDRKIKIMRMNIEVTACNAVN